MSNLTFSITLGVFHGLSGSSLTLCHLLLPPEGCPCTAPQALLPSDFSLGLASGEPRLKMGRKEDSDIGNSLPGSPWSHCRLLHLSPEDPAPPKCSSLCVPLPFWLLVSRPSPHHFRSERSAPLLGILGQCSTLWVALLTALLSNSPLIKLSSNYPS